MDKQKLVEDLFNQEFNQERYEEFLTELFNKEIYEESDISYQIDKGFEEYIESAYDYGQYTDSDEEELKLYVIKLKKTTSLERARTMQRNFIAKLLSDEFINHGLVAFYDDNQDWRLSFVKIDYQLDEEGKVIEKLTPAKRHSYLVGPNQSNHTCQKQFFNLINYDKINVNEINKIFKVENVTDEFFNTYKELFHSLTEEINKLKENDDKISKEFEDKKIKSTDFAKKILGQIVFIYFIQKKGWLGLSEKQKWGEGPKNFIRKLYEKEYVDYTNFFNEVLEPLFYEGLSTETIDNHYSKFNCKIPFINGGIFENINNYDWINTDLNIDNKIFKKILDTFDTFNFTVKEDEPLEKEVAIDPEMLGKVFEKLLEVNERKDKGAFYTPRKIVHEICQETLISYLDTNTEDIPKTDIEQFIKEGYLAIDSIIRVQEEKLDTYEANKQIPLPNTIIAQMGIIEELLNEVKVVDPAVGSGAFPVGMLTEIVQAKYIIQLLQGYNEINMYDLKRETIENSLYAVDISYSATDITKLRFWLSLIVDEEKIKKIRPLPNLDNKIMCGNSVIDRFEGIKLFNEDVLKTSTSKQTKLFDPTGKAFKQLILKKSKYFNENSHEEKIKLKKEIQDIKWTFIEESLQENMKKGTKQKEVDEILEKLQKYKYAESKPFFIWELEFSEIFTTENPGFDIVIGNPPYVRQEKIKELKPILKEIYETYTGTADLYVYFFEKGIKLLKEQGCLSYITSNKYTQVKYGKLLRKYLNNNTIKNFVDYNGINVFKDATVDSCTILIQKGLPQKNKILINNDFYFKQDDINDEVWIFERPEFFNLKKKISKNKLINEINEVNLYYGIKTGYNKAFIIDNETRTKLIDESSSNKKIIKPILRGKDIEKYKIKQNNLFLICTKDGIDIQKEYPILYSYLTQFKDKLIKRSDQGFHYTNLRTCNYYDKFSEPKIIWQRVCKKPNFVLDNKNYYVIDSMVFLTLDSQNKYLLEYLLMIFNSNVIEWYLKRIGHKLGKTGFLLSNQYVKKLPIPETSMENQNRYKRIVKKLIELKEEYNEDNLNQIRDYENYLNKEVYTLFNLNYNEIDMIEQDLR